MVAKDTFRPQYFHRNVSTEVLGIIEESQMTGGFVKGILSVTNMLSPHGIPGPAWEAASNAGPEPMMRDGLYFVLETQWPIVLTAQAARAVTETDDEALGGASTLQSHFHQ